MRNRIISALLSGLAFAAPMSALADDGSYWWSGDWYLKVGATGFVAPRYDGSKDYLFQAAPLVSLGKAGQTVRFSSRNDNPSFAVLDSGPFRAGIVGKLIMPRNADDSDDLKGLKPVKLGVEAGVFAEAYPTDWFRVRGEIRRGIRSHDGVVADLAADGFVDLAPTVRLSAGPRLSFSSNDYMDAYYKVNTQQSNRSGLSKYNPSGGIQSAGIGAAITWQATDKIEASAFTEYKRLLGDVADSSLVRERGSKNQFVIGLSSTYRFDFNLP
ncbi:MAG: scaffolding protein [Rhizobium sp.]|nr:scaffolding protein [Rhizobium sp.]